MARTLRLPTTRLWQMMSLLVLAFCFDIQTQLAYSQEPTEADAAKVVQLYNSIPWQKGPTKVLLGSLAEIQIPDGYQFSCKEGVSLWNEMTQNPADPKCLGIIMPVDAIGDWFLTFTFDDIGYVPDSDKAHLDANAILTAIRAETEEANKERRNRGWAELRISGWQQQPAYDSITNHLVWAIHGQSGPDTFANYDMRILGRQGVMAVKLVASPEQINATVPTVKGLLTAFQFTSGNQYAEMRNGDKMAEYGLTGLITGGSVAAAAKTGLLTKFGALIAKGGKFVLVALAALVAGIAKLFTSKAKKDGSP